MRTLFFSILYCLSFATSFPLFSATQWGLSTSVEEEIEADDKEEPKNEISKEFEETKHNEDEDEDE